MNNLNLGITIAVRDLFSSRAARISRGFSSLDDTAYRAARGISHAAMQIEEQIFDITRALAASAAILSTVAWPTKKAMEFGTAVSEIATIADEASLNLKKVEETLINQSFRFPTTPLQQAEAAYQAVSAGFIESAQALRVVEDATELAVTTRTKTPLALRGLTGVLNAYAPFFGGQEKAATQGDYVADLLFETIRRGRLRMDELGKYIGYVASSAAIGGVNIEDMLANLSTMTLGSLSPEQSAQYLRQLMIGTLRPTRIAQRIGDKYGINFGIDAIEEFGGEWSGWLFNAYDTIIGQGGDMSEFARLLSGRQAFAGAATIINLRDKFREIRQGMEDRYAVDELGQVITTRERALGIQQKELSYQLKRLVSGWEAVITVMGRAPKQALEPITALLATMTGGILQVVQAVPMISKVFATFATTAGISVLVYAITRIKALKNAMLELKQAAKVTAYPLFGMRVTLFEFTRVVGGAVLIVGGLVSLIKKAYDSNWMGLADKVRRTTLVMRSLFHAFMNLDGKWGTITQTMYDQLEKEGLLGTFRSLFMLGYRIRSFFMGIADGFRQFMISLGLAIYDGLSWVANKLEDIFPGLAGYIQSAAEWIKDLKIEESDVDRWRNIGYTFGMIAAGVAAVVIPLLAWKSILLVSRGLLWTMTAPLKAMKFLMWDIWVTPLMAGIRHMKKLKGLVYGTGEGMVTWTKKANFGRGGFVDKGTGQFTGAENAGWWAKTKRWTSETLTILAVKGKAIFGWLGRAATSVGKVLMSALRPLRWIITGAAALVGTINIGLAAAVAAVVAGVALLVWKWDAVKAGIAGAVDYVANKMPRTMQLLSGIGAAVIAPFVGWKKIMDWIWGGIRMLADSQTWRQVTAGAVTAWAGIQQSFADTLERIKTDVTQRIPAFFAGIKNRFMSSQFMQGVEVMVGGIGSAFSATGERVKAHVSGWWDALLNSKFAEGVSTLWEGVGNAVSGAWERMAVDIGGAWDWVQRSIAPVFDWMQGKIAQVREWIEPVTTWLSDFIGEWAQLFRDIASGIAGALKGLKDRLLGERVSETAEEAVQRASALQQGDVAYRGLPRLMSQAQELLGGLSDNDYLLRSREDFGMFERPLAVRDLTGWLDEARTWLDTGHNKALYQEGHLPLYGVIQSLVGTVENKVRELKGDSLPETRDTTTLGGLSPDDISDSVEQGAYDGVTRGLNEVVNNVYDSNAYRALWNQTVGRMGLDEYNQYLKNLDDEQVRTYDGDLSSNAQRDAERLAGIMMDSSPDGSISRDEAKKRSEDMANQLVRALQRAPAQSQGPINLRVFLGGEELAARVQPYSQRLEREEWERNYRTPAGG